MLIDRAVVEVRSGNGGDGHISFLHDKNTEWGGPDGGNGGDGGSVYFLAKNNLNTLFPFRHSPLLSAEDGEKGMKKLMAGKRGNDLIVEVPTGTVVIDERDGHVLADLDEPGKKALVAKGGRGGRGNASYKSSRRRIPRIAQNGEKGERFRIVLELKMIADVGLVGLPSAGKSTFLNLVSRANALTADYPFSTLSPNLGVTYLEDGDSFVVADLPGLIEGASQGKGLGTSFLRHAERTRVLVHLVAMDGMNDPVKAYKVIRKELEAYGGHLEERPEIVVASKMDVEGAAERKAEFDKELGIESFPLSSYERGGEVAILKKCEELLSKAPKFPLKGEEEKIRAYHPLEENLRLDDYVLLKEKGAYVVHGKKIEEDAARIQTKTEEGMMRLLSLLRKARLEEKLKAAGAKDGDEVRIGEVTFVYEE